MGKWGWGWGGEEGKVGAGKGLLYTCPWLNIFKKTVRHSCSREVELNDTTGIPGTENHDGKGLSRV